MKTMVFWSFCCSSRSCSCISRRISGSSALKASSMSRMSLSAARARAMPTRCCIPPESSEGSLALALESDEGQDLLGLGLALGLADPLSSSG